MKKIISLVLSLVMLMSISVTAFASETQALADVGMTIEETETTRIARAYDGDTLYVSTLDKVSNTMTTERFSPDGTRNAVATVDLNQNIISAIDYTTGETTRATTVSKTTESKYAYEYTNTSPKKWKLVRPKYAGEASSGGYYFRANQTTTNKSDLNEFRVTVNSIASKESELKTLVGLASFLGGFATGFAIGSGGTGFGVAVAAYLAAAGFGVAAQQKANEIGELQDTAYSRYYDVFHNSVVYD